MSSRTYLTILSDSAARYPTRPVFKIPVPPPNDTTAREWKDITYAQFAKDIDFYARFWTHRLTIGGMPSGTIIGLWVGGFEYADILHIYGLTKAGYIPQLFPGRLPNSAVIFELMEMAGAKALIHTADFGPVAESPVPTYVVQTLNSNDVKDVPHLPPPTRQPGLDDIVVIYHTSGSTGRLPKLVRCSYRWLENMVAKSATITEPKDPNRQDVTVWMGSMAHSPQNFMLMGAIQHGSCTVQPTKVPYDTDELLDMIKFCNLNRINIYSPPLTTFLRISKQDQEVLRALTQLDDVLYSGLALPQEEENWARKNGVHLTNIFGSTECGALLVSVGGSGAEARLFRPLDHTAYAFIPVDSLDETETPQTKLLELVVLSQSGDCPEPSRRSQDGHFHTGDFFAEVIPGFYASRGRDDDWIKLANAVRCDTKGIEDEVRAVCADIMSECVVVGTGRRCPSLFVEAAVDSIKMDTDQLKLEIVRRMYSFNSRRYIEERISNPRLVFVVASGSLPRTSTKGNIRRRAVEETYKGDMDKAYESLML